LLFATFTGTQVFNHNGLVSMVWLDEWHVEIAEANSYDNVYFTSFSVDYYESFSSAGVTNGYYYYVYCDGFGWMEVEDVSLGPNGVSGVNSGYYDGVLASQGSITSRSNINDFPGVLRDSNLNQSTISNGKALTGGGKPSDANVNIALPQVPKANGYANPSSNFGDSFESDLASIRGRGLAFGNQIKKDAVVVADVAAGMTNLGSLKEAVTGTTLTGQELTTFERGLAGASVAFAPLAVVTKIAKVGKGADAVTDVAKGLSKHTDDVADGAGLAMRHADDLAKAPLVYKHNLPYADKVHDKALKDKAGHGFPYSFDDIILAAKPNVKPDGYKVYQKPGTLNGNDGIYEIGVTLDGVIDHRVFRSITPPKMVIK